MNILRILLMLLPFTAAQAQQEGESTIDRGKAIYYDHACYSCHGFNGTGRVPLANGVSAIAGNEQAFMVYLRARAELNPILPSTEMPNYDAQSLNDSQVKDLFAYISSLKEKLPDINDDPLMQQLLDSRK